MHRWCTHGIQVQIFIHPILIIEYSSDGHLDGTESLPSSGFESSFNALIHYARIERSFNERGGRKEQREEGGGGEGGDVSGGGTSKKFVVADKHHPPASSAVVIYLGRRASAIYTRVSLESARSQSVYSLLLTNRGVEESVPRFLIHHRSSSTSMHVGGDVTGCARAAIAFACICMEMGRRGRGCIYGCSRRLVTHVDQLPTRQIPRLFRD